MGREISIVFLVDENGIVDSFVRLGTLDVNSFDCKVEEQEYNKWREGINRHTLTIFKGSTNKESLELENSDKDYSVIISKVFDIELIYNRVRMDITPTQELRGLHSIVERIDDLSCQELLNELDELEIEYQVLPLCNPRKVKMA